MRLLIFVILALTMVPSLGQEKNSADTVIFISDPIPTYPGGFTEMQRFIKQNLKYPVGTMEVQEKVYVEFVVNEDGLISDVKIAKGLTEPFNNNALELVTRMPKWIPAKSKGKPIRTKMVLLVSFER